jgi:dTDP-glucose 4,6-dehydratase|tara:strand:+ start:72 stop:407 length:336 start_codon:yes stop_codon:yes gene_type:complete
MVIYVDIDETICESPEDRNYSLAVPIEENIEKINALYEAGHTIVYWTARGSGSGIDWRETTEDQFKLWGVKHHELKLGKPVYDLFIDDKNYNTDMFFKASADQLVEALEEE